MLDDGYADAVITEVEVHLDWMDRVRVLLRGHLHVHVFAQTEHLVGRATSRSRVSVPPFRYRQPSQTTVDALHP